MSFSEIAPYAVGVLLACVGIVAIVAVTLKFPGRMIASVPVVPGAPATLSFTSPGPREFKGNPDETGAHVHAWLYLSLARESDELMGLHIQVRVEVDGALVSDAGFPLTRGTKRWGPLSPLCENTPAGLSVNSNSSGVHVKSVIALAPIPAAAGANARVTVVVTPHAGSRVIALRLAVAQPEIETWKNRFVVDPHLRDHDLWLREIDAVRVG